MTLFATVRNGPLLQAVRLILLLVLLPTKAATVEDISKRVDRLVVVNEGLHHREYAGLTVQTNGGVGNAFTNSGYIHLEMGMNFLDKDGVLRPADPLIEIAPDGAEVKQAAMKIHFNSDINTEGAVEMESPEKHKLKGSPLGLSYYDPVSGQSVLIAETRSTIGQIVAPNKVVYVDFLDNISADAVYEVSKAGLMQLIIIKEDIAPPSAYGLPDETSRLEVISEFLTGQEPEKRTRTIKEERDPAKRGQMVEPDFTDTSLRFADTVISEGVAFGINQNVADPAKKHPVGKQWVNRPEEGRSILIEAVEYSGIKEDLKALPKQIALPGRRAGFSRSLPAKRMVTAARKEIQLAQASYAPRGFVVDWQSVVTQPAFTFGADTYLISGTVTLGTATFNPGAVIKYNTGASLNVTYLNWNGTALAPTVFTAKDDNSVGAEIPGSTGAPSGVYAATAINCVDPYYTQNIRYARVRFAANAIRLRVHQVTQGGHVVRDSYLEDCTTGVYIESVTSPPVTLSNIQTCNVQNLYYLYYFAATPTMSGIVDCGGPRIYQEIPKTAPTMTADASSYWTGWEPSRAIDGLLTEPTWHSAPEIYPASGQWIRLRLNQSKTIGKLKYYPRPAAANGTFTSYKVFVTDDNSTSESAWGSPVASGTWNWPNVHEEVLEFYPPVNGKYIIFQCVAGVANWAAAGELWAYEVSGAPIASTPTFSPVGGTYASPLTLTLNCLTPNTLIRYTTDGSDPQPGGTSVPAGGAITLYGPGTFTVKARAYRSDLAASPIANGTYSFSSPPIVASPTFSPAAGTYGSGLQVTLSCSTPGATIYYTTDGTLPTQSSQSGTIFTLSGVGPKTVRAKAFKLGMTESLVSTIGYYLEETLTADHIEIPKGPSTMTATPQDCSSYFVAAHPWSTGIDWLPQYVIDGQYLNDPCWHSGWIPGQTWPNDPVQQNPQWVRVRLSETHQVSAIKYYPRTSAGNGSFLQYKVYVTTSDSNDPAQWGLPVLDESFTWPDGAKIRARSFTPKAGQFVIFQCLQGNADWAAVGEVWIYKKKIDSPTITAVYEMSQVTLTAGTSVAGAAIYYTTNGDEPIQGGGTSQLYMGPIKLSAAATTKWKAFKANYVTSDTASHIVQKLSPPIISPNGGAIADNSPVNITAPGGFQVKALVQRPTLLDSSPWQVGVWGNQLPYTRNGDIPENTVELRATPHGTTEKVWVAYNLDISSGGSFDPDGGFLSGSINIDRTKLYRFSVWIKKNDSTPSASSGYTYLGCRRNSVSDLTGTPLDAAVLPYSYFWYGILPPNEWHQIVGHVYPAGYTGTTIASKVFNSRGQQISSGVFNEFRWASAATTTAHLSFLYYCTEAGISQEFWNPRIEQVPSISEPADVAFAAAEPSPKALSVRGVGSVPVRAISYSSTALASDVATASFLIADSDSDGLPDSWEQKSEHFQGLGQGALGDWDGDGLTNLQEYQNGLNPTSADTDADGIIDTIFDVAITQPSALGSLP